MSGPSCTETLLAAAPFLEGGDAIVFLQESRLLVYRARGIVITRNWSAVQRRVVLLRTSICSREWSM